jgi:hypothetical protein
VIGRGLFKEMPAAQRRERRRVLEDYSLSVLSRLSMTFLPR